LPVAIPNQTHYTFLLDMNNETPKPRKPYTLTPAGLEARRKVGSKSIHIAAQASAKARRGKAPGGATTKDMVSLKVSPATLVLIDNLRLPGESRHQCVHRLATTAAKRVATRKPKPKPSA